MFIIASTNFELPPSSDRGNLGIYHLKRFWSKALTGPGVVGKFPDETLLDQRIIDILALGWLPCLNYLYHERPTFDLFEEWVKNNGNVTTETISLCNAVFENKTREKQSSTPDVLTAEELQHWDTHGYVIVRNAVSRQDCADSRKAIWDFLQMDEHDETTWYRHTTDLQGIMVPLYRHPAIDKNRNSTIIKKAFEQVWNRSDLVVTTDKCGFNPPETRTCRYRGIGLHWDVSLAMPIPFGTQGILYLTDTAANQGALTVVPGFHKQLEHWLTQLPETINPREADLSAFTQEPIAANAGDFIIWNNKLPHSASPNRASLPRIVQYINWYAPTERISEKWI